MRKTALSIAISLLFYSLSLAQNYSQNIRGRVLDKVTRQALPGANIILNNAEPALGTSSDENGYFVLSNVPTGRVGITVSFLGYSPAQFNNLMLTSGKEMVVNVELEEMVTTYDEVVVKASKPKTRANNDMAIVSARSFTTEETEKYAGSRGDVARMASNFAGVSFSNDSRNDIVIRGNSPAGLLWKLEDVEIPNPNHFAENGTTGGPVGMLNNNVLRNSDFLTGAFPAEYGNAMSGVFDLKMRNGNTEKHEFTGQFGFNGFELGAEGPIARSNKSSYMAFYRYSTLGLFEKIGINFGTSGIPEYQDFTFKVNSPTKKGVISAFGLAGKSQISMLTSKMKKDDMYNSEGTDLNNRSSLASGGLSYTHFVSSATSVKVSVSGLFQNGGTDIDTLERKIWKIDTTQILNKTTNIKTLRIDTSYFFENPTRYLEQDITEFRNSVSLTVTSKLNARFSQKTGLLVDLMGYGLSTNLYIDTLKRMHYIVDEKKELINGPQLIRSYYAVSYKITDNIILNPGLHLVYFTLSKQVLPEPRAAINWRYAANRSINFGYGLHSRTHALSTYYYGTLNPDHTIHYSNLNLKAMQSHQFVLGHDWNLSNELRLKTETYYQNQFNVPVENLSSSFSILNYGVGWGPSAAKNLVNKGTGYNYGLEITFEKFLSRNYYFLLTTSLFDSKYKGSDGILRNTAFNGNYVINSLVGYEIQLNEKRSLFFDLKATLAGGKRKTPIDLAESRKFGESRYDHSRAFEEQFGAFFKLDFKFGMRENGKRFSQEWYLYIENLTNHKNPFYETYSKYENKVITNYQLGFFPVGMWRINF